MLKRGLKFHILYPSSYTDESKTKSLSNDDCSTLQFCESSIYTFPIPHPPQIYFHPNKKMASFPESIRGSFLPGGLDPLYFFLRGVYLRF